MCAGRYVHPSGLLYFYSPPNRRSFGAPRSVETRYQRKAVDCEPPTSSARVKVFCFCFCFCLAPNSPSKTVFLAKRGLTLCERRIFIGALPREGFVSQVTFYLISWQRRECNISHWNAIFIRPKCATKAAREIRVIIRNTHTHIQGALIHIFQVFLLFFFVFLSLSFPFSPYTITKHFSPLILPFFF